MAKDNEKIMETKTEACAAVDAAEEAERCLKCRMPMCRKGCPIGTNIPEMNRLFLEGKMEEAGKMLFENNPMSLICAIVCDHEKQCEGHCVLAKRGKAIKPWAVERVISGEWLPKMTLERLPRTGQRVAIVGSGPAGLTVGLLLGQRGYDVTLFDARDKIGGVLRYGIPEYRLPHAIIDRYEELLLSVGVKIRPVATIGRILTIDDLERDGYKAIFISSGAWRPTKLNIKGESLGNVHFAINYLVNPDVFRLGKTVVVIGAGNSAIDVARTALRKGAENVFVFCRRGHARASAVEIGEALEEGVKMMYGYRPEEFTDDGVIYRKAELDKQDNVLSLSEPRLFPCDSIVVAAGQGTLNQIVSTTTGLDISEKGLLLTQEDGGTSRPGIFAAGDVVTGAKTVVAATRNSKEVADAMDRYLQSLRARDQFRAEILQEEQRVKNVRLPEDSRS